MLPKGESRMNTTIYASTSGEGPDVLLLHGLFGQGSNLCGRGFSYIDYYSRRNF